MEKKNIDVVVAGHICFDITPAFGDLFAGKKMAEILIPGQLISVGAANLSTGGPVSNTGLNIARLGSKVSLTAKIGDDMFGKGIIDMLKKKVDIKGMKIVKGENSSYTVAIVVPGTDRIFLHHSGTNDTFGFSDIDFSLVKDSRLFHLGYPPVMKKLYSNGGAELIKIFKHAKSLGVTTSLDMSLPGMNSESAQIDWDGILKKLIPYVDIFLPSFEEITFMLDRKRYDQLKKIAGINKIDDIFTADDMSRLSSKLLGYGAKVVVIKCSHRGMYLRTAKDEPVSKINIINAENVRDWAGREIWAPSFKVEKIMSATGAGDSSIAGFLTAFLKNSSAEYSARCGNVVGSMNLRAYDALSGIGTWSEVSSIAKNMKAKMNDSKVNSHLWSWNKKDCVWFGPRDSKR